MLCKSTRQSKAQASKATPPPGPAPKVTRSAAKRTLPAVPPPMPNGLNSEKPKPFEYKPYRPRPKYTFEDFELDDDPVPVAPAKPSPQSRPAQPTRPNVQSDPTVQSKPTVSPHPSNQARPQTQPTAAGQISGQLKPFHATAPQSKATAAAAAAAASSRAIPSTKAQIKSPALTAPQSKAASAPGQSKPAAPASPQLKPAASGGTAQLRPSTSAASRPAGSATPAAPQKTPNPPTSEESKSKVTQKQITSQHVSQTALMIKDVTHPVYFLCRMQLIHLHQLPLTRPRKCLMALSSVKKSLQVCVYLHMIYLNSQD